ncbi:MAG: hypothetical protein DRH37_02835 [Deltaproteobacteria bacterium]|nr:MAG: hypothetical protein DRH37_02835 [Deltaproteobacteria bacterium]
MVVFVFSPDGLPLPLKGITSCFARKKTNRRIRFRSLAQALLDQYANNVDCLPTRWKSFFSCAYIMNPRDGSIGRRLQKSRDTTVTDVIVPSQGRLLPCCNVLAKNIVKSTDRRGFMGAL